MKDLILLFISVLFLAGCEAPQFSRYDEFTKSKVEGTQHTFIDSSSSKYKRIHLELQRLTKDNVEEYYLSIDYEATLSYGDKALKEPLIFLIDGEPYTLPAEKSDGNRLVKREQGYIKSIEEKRFYAADKEFLQKLANGKSVKYRFPSRVYDRDQIVPRYALEKYKAFLEGH